jgi:hypothetical protein
VTEGTQRRVWLLDRYGAEIETDVTVEHVGRLLDSIAVDDGDDEHRSVSVADQDAWNLEYYPDSVLLENVEADGGEVGSIRGLSRDERLALAADFLAGDFAALRARDWT